MSRIPDYEEMRLRLANRYQNMDDEVILEEFIELFGQHHIPKILSQDDMNKHAIEQHDLRIKYEGDEDERI